MSNPEYVEPPLTCPLIDAFIAKHAPDAGIVMELESIRNINSQLRYSLWHEKLRADELSKMLTSTPAVTSNNREG